MACEQVGGGAVLCQPAGDGGAVWWDAGGNALWVWDWGPIVDWATVLVAVVAVAAAWRASNRSHRLQSDLNRLEQEREDRSELELERRIEAEERAIQADHVAAWLSDAQHAGSVQWEVVNGGGLPIYEVWLEVLDRHNGSVLLRKHVPMIAPGGLKTISMMSGEAPVKMMIFGARWAEAGRLTFAARIAFQDTANKNWLRDERGVLTKICDPHPAG